MCAQADILATLAYFDIFQYPLTQTEIYLFLGKTCSHEEFVSMLQDLQHEARIYKLDEFYCLHDDYHLVLRRRKGNLKAKQMLKTAEQVSAFLSKFPFVRGVAVSGSLSKNYADDASDIDFFIITKRNRLWIARTLMHCFKKLSFLFGKQHLFCMNYYIDEEVLQIKEKNIYTSTEIATLLPLHGIASFKNFYEANTWSRSYLPNHSMRISYVQEIKRSWLKVISETLLDNPVGSVLDVCLMKITAFRWKQKTKKKKLNKRGVVMGMVCNRHCAKPNPENFQNKLLKLYHEKINGLSYYEKVQTII